MTCPVMQDLHRHLAAGEDADALQARIDRKADELFADDDAATQALADEIGDVLGEVVDLLRQPAETAAAPLHALLLQVVRQNLDQRAPAAVDADIESDRRDAEEARHDPYED